MRGNMYVVMYRVSHLSYSNCRETQICGIEAKWTLTVTQFRTH